MREDSIEITATKSGDLKIQRFIAGALSDRVIVNANRDMPKRDTPWIAAAMKLLTQPSAEVVIEPIPVMPLEPNIFDRLAKANEDAESYKAAYETLFTKCMKEFDDEATPA